MPSDGIGTVDRDSFLERTPRWMFAVCIVVAVAIVSYPNLRGFWGRDDFAQLAMARMIGAPGQYFVIDHFFVRASVFRPLGFLSQWLCVKLFGIGYGANAAFDIALHAAVALCLFRVLLRTSIPPLVAALCTLLFAVHPVTIGPSLWWSARFDVLSTLFIFMAISAGIRYRERATTLSLLGALLAALAAMLSKENGVVAIAALTLIWGRWVLIAPVQRKRALIAIAAAWLTGTLFLVWRGVVLETFSSRVTGPVSLADAIPRGLLNWARDVAAYLSFVPRLTALQTGLIAAGLAVALIAVAAARLAPTALRFRVNIEALLIGLLLFVFPIIAQAPIAAFASPLSADTSAIEAGMQSRLYYLQTAGLMLMLASVITPLCRAAKWPGIAVAVSMALVAATFAWVSHESAQEFGQRSFDIAAPARAAVVATESLVLPEEHCHIAFLGYEPPPEWGVYVSMDSIVKALSARKAVRHCWIHSDIPTYLYLQPASVVAADALPFTPNRYDGVESSWPRLGKLRFAYLTAPDEKASVESGMPFFIWKDGHFVNATADVRAGAVPVRLK